MHDVSRWGGMAFGGSSATLASAPTGPRDGTARSRRVGPGLRVTRRVEFRRTASESLGLTFEEIALPNLDAAYRLALWLVRDPHLAEEVVQDAVARGLSYFASFRGGDGRAWLMKIVRNTAYTALAARRQSGRRLDEGTAFDGFAILELPDPGDNPETALSRRQDAERVEQALARLPVELRECLVLRELEALSYKEVAEITGVPIGTVMSRLWRARRALIGSAVEGVNDES